MSSNGKRQETPALDAAPLLPQGWEWASLDDLAANEPRSITDGPFGSNLKTEHYTSHGPRVLRLQNIGDGVFVDERAHISPEHFASLQKHRVEAGDVVIAALGERLPRACLIPPTVGPAVVKADCIRFKPSSELIAPAFVTYMLNAEPTRTQVAAVVHGVGRPRLNLKEIRSIRLPVPPRTEQDRIIAEIERQLSLLDAGVAALRRVQANLKRYRASVLQAACSGRLVPTEAELAHAEGREYQPAEMLLKRMTPARRSRWNAQADATQLPMLPEGWCWASWDQLAERVTVGFVGPMKQEYVERGIPFLRSQNVRENKYDPKGLCFINPEFHARIQKSRLHPGDLLVVRSGSVGVTCVVPDHLREANCSDLVVIQRPRGVLPAYGAYWMNSRARGEVKAGQVGIALTHFNTQSVAQLAVAVPPLEEQQRIVAEVERRRSVIDETEALVQTNLKRAERLRQSILKRAFEGKLVPQDPNDEPASVLLERIRAERAAVANGSSRTNGRQPSRKRTTQPALELS